MRLAWFTPWPPDRHPAARRSRDVVGALAARGDEIDLVVPDEAAHTAPPPGVPLVRASDAAARLARRAPDLCVYHVVNSPAGAFIWPHAAARPGLTLLHDVHLYAARAADVLADAARAPGGAAPARGDLRAAFRSEFAASHPDVNPDAAELAIAGFTGAYEALWPMTRLVVDRSRAVAVPTTADAEALRSIAPHAAVLSVAAGIDVPPAAGGEGARQAWRAELGLPDAAVVFALGLEPDDDPEGRRVPQILRAFASTVGRVPGTRLLLAGAAAIDVPPDLRRGLVHIGAVTGATRWHVMNGADVLIDLHWPRTGGPGDDGLTALAAGRPAIVLDSVASDPPALDPRSWRPPADGRAPLGVAIDILDEDHSLRLAMYRLAIDAPLRDRLGQSARARWRDTHTLDRMVSDVAAAIDRAIAEPTGDRRPGGGGPASPGRHVQGEPR